MNDGLMHSNGKTKLISHTCDLRLVELAMHHIAHTSDSQITVEIHFGLDDN